MTAHLHRPRADAADVRERRIVRRGEFALHLDRIPVLDQRELADLERLVLRFDIKARPESAPEPRRGESALGPVATIGVAVSLQELADDLAAVALQLGYAVTGRLGEGKRELRVLAFRGLHHRVGADVASEMPRQLDLRIRGNRHRGGFAAEQPVELANQQVLRFGLGIDVVLAPFGGARSGTEFARLHRLLHLVRKLRREKHPTGAASAPDRIGVASSIRTDHDRILPIKRRGAEGRIGSADLELRTRAPDAIVRAGGFHPLPPGDLPLRLAGGEALVIFAGGLEDEAAAIGKLRERGMIADASHDRTENMLTGLERNAVSVVLPVGNIGTVGSAGDELSVQRQIETLIGRDIDLERLLALLHLEILFENHHRTHRGVLLRIMRDLPGADGHREIIIMPNPFRRINRLDLHDVRVPASRTSGTKNPLGFGEQGYGQKRQRANGDNLVHILYYNKKTATVLWSFTISPFHSQACTKTRLEISTPRRRI